MAHICRFAPSTTGPAHPGTLIAGLLAWLDARSRNAPFILRLEDLDPDRAQDNFTEAMLEDFTWFRLDWDKLETQSNNRKQHEDALDTLAAKGRLYPCSMSRSEIKKHGITSPDGGYAYPNTNRDQPLPDGGWRDSNEPLRARLPDQIFSPKELSHLDLSQNPGQALGDPIVRRRDGAIAYNLAVVVDDDATGISHVVRGSDIASSTATQLALMDILGIESPTYRHHFLVLEPRGEKLAKLHGSIGVPTLRNHYSASQLCGLLAHLAGLTDTPSPQTPKDLLQEFTWDRVRKEDTVLKWDESSNRLSWSPKS